MSAIRPPPGSSTSISPMSSPGPIVSEPARTLDACLAPRAPAGDRSPPPNLHDRLSVRVLALRAESQDRVEQLARKQREDLWILDEPLVAAAVEEERPALSVARELDLPEEERVVAAPVGADDPRDEVRERALDERRLMHDLERRLGELVGHAAGEAVREPGLPGLEHAHAEPCSPSCRSAPILRATVDRDRGRAAARARPT